MHARLLFLACLFIISNRTDAQWTHQIIPNSTGSIRCAYFKSTSEGYVGGVERIRKTLNGGTTWDTASYGIASTYLGTGIVESIHFVNANEGIASGWNFWDNCEIVFKTYDGGLTWNSIRHQGAFGTAINDMAFASSTEGFCVGKAGHILHTTNKGDSWSFINSGTTNDLFGVYFIGSTGWIVGSQVILKTTNSGASWSPITFPGEFFQNVHFVNANVGYAIGTHIYKTVNGGNTWVQLNGPSGGNDIFATHVDTLFAAGSAGLFKSADGGTTWYPQYTLPVKNYMGIWFMNSAFGYATSFDGQVYKTTTGGDPIPQNDAGVSSIQPLPAGSCLGTYPIQVQIKNYGQAPLTQARIVWRVDGWTQPFYNWTGNLPHDSVSGIITLGTYNFTGGNHPLMAYTTYANSLPEVVHANDSASANYNFPQLSGVYTIGGVNPDYTTPDNAITALSTYGTCGSIEFRLRNGTYSGMSIVGFIPDHVTDSVLFTSESGDSSQVIIQSGSIALSYIDSRNIRFSHMTFRQTGSGDDLIKLNGTIQNLRFSNCSFKGITGSTALLSHDGFAMLNLQINNCRFAGTFSGINIDTYSSSVFNNGLSIQNCVFDSVRNAITILKTKGLVIEDNIIQYSQAQSSTAIALTSCNNGFLINRNKMMLYQAGKILSVTDCYDSTGTGGIITNNYISNSLYTTTQNVALDGYNISFNHNTVNSNATASVSFATDTLSTGNYNFQNNIISNRTNKPVLQVNITQGSNGYLNSLFTSIGHNAYYYIPNTNINVQELFFSNGSFDDWKHMFPADTTSLLCNPAFPSYTDYHVSPNASNRFISNIGVVIAGVGNDIDGNIRSATPDPGCVEFISELLDGGILNDHPQTRICAGSNPVPVQLMNYGLSTITSGTVNWKVNGITQPSYAWAGNVAPGNTSPVFSPGNYNFINGNTYDILVWLSNPNGSADMNLLNDTVQMTVISNGLSGTYTIGGVSPDYTTFTSAVNALKLSGVCGPVVFNARPGTYQDSLYITPIPGASASNTITFQSENGDSSSVIIYYHQTRVIRIDSAAYINFNRISILDTLSSLSCIYLSNGAHDINATYCQMTGLGGKGIMSDGKYVYNITMDHCFIRGESGLYIPSGTITSKNLTFTNNVLTNIIGNGVYTTNSRDILIDHNNFNSNGCTAGISITNTTFGKVTITNNSFDIHNSVRGINCLSSGFAGEKNVIANNMVSVYGSNVMYGIDLINTDNMLIVNNSVLLDSNVNNHWCLNAPLMESSIINNSLFNNGAGGAMLAVINPSISSDYNNFYANGNDPIYIGSQYSHSLSEWQLMTGSDMHSVSGNPAYTSIHDLHAPTSTFLSSNGSPQIYFANDIDGDVRSGASDIGADEFNLVLQANDAGVMEIQYLDTVCPGSNPIYVRIRNYGSTTLTSAVLNWTVNGISQPPFSWSGSLPSLGISSFFSIGNYNYATIDTFDINVWTTLPNGNADPVSLNDLATAHTVSRMQGTFTIGGAAPDFPTLFDAVRILKINGICGPVVFNIRPGTYLVSGVTIPELVGSSAANTVTFQSETGDSTEVIFNNSAWEIFILNGADYIRIQKLTLDGGYIFPNYAIDLEGNSDHNVITSCVVNGGIGVGSYSECNYNLVENNTIDGEVYLTAYSLGTAFGNVIRKNLLTGDNGIKAYSQESFVIDQNVIMNTDSFAMPASFGIRIFESQGTCTKNSINGNYSWGMRVEGIFNGPNLIANNLIVMGDDAMYAIELNADSIDFLYNTVIMPPGFNTYLMAGLYSSSNATVKNNQFINYGSNPAIELPDTITNSLVCDYNNYYSNGPTLIQSGWASYSSLAAYSAVSGSDLHSTNVDPQFPSMSVLFPTNPLALQTGTPLALVTDDYYGTLRHPAFPSMGALEAQPVIVDDSTNKDIEVILLNDTILIGNNTISVKVKNNHPFNVDSAYHNYLGVIDTLYFSYRVNGGTTVNQMWTGSLALDDSITFNFPQQFSAPNGKLYSFYIEVNMSPRFTVINFADDTLTKEIGSAMFGVYTVGGVSPDFPSCKSAIYSLLQMHTSGDVTLSIRPGLDSIVSIYQFRDDNSVTFQSETGVASDVQIVLSYITNCKNIHFKSVTLYPSSDDSNGSQLICQNFSFDSCIVEGSLTDPDRRWGLVLVRCDSASVTNCHFKNIEDGVSFSSRQYYGSNSFYEKCYVLNNIFDSVETAINVHGRMWDTVLIAGNTINNAEKGLSLEPAGISLCFNIEKNNVTSASVKSLEFIGTNGDLGYLNASNNMFNGNVSVGDPDFLEIHFDYNSFQGQMWISDCVNFHMHNSSVSNAAPGTAYYFGQFNGIVATYDCDYNNYYNSIGNNTYIRVNTAGGLVTDLAQLIALTGEESHTKQVNPNYLSATNLHSNAPQLNNAGIPLPGFTTDIDNDTRSLTTPDIGADEYTPVDSLVWPGDCNYDGVANNYDLLSIGSYFNQSGVARASVSNAWVGQLSSDWGSLQYCGFDKKHADCNGDGIITWSDTTAIRQNWGQAPHPYRFGEIHQVSTQPDLFIVINDTLLNPGDSVHAEIHLGNSSTPVDSIHGIAFDIAYTNDLVEQGSMYMTFPPSFLGIENVTAITISNITNLASGAITRILPDDTSGYGIIAMLHFVIDPQASSIANLNLDVFNYLALTAGGTSLTFNPVSDSVLVFTTVGLNSLNQENKLQIFPNPLINSAQLAYTLDKESQVLIELITPLGQTVAVLKNGNESSGLHVLPIEFDREKIPSGIYYVRMNAGGKIFLAKLILS